MKTRAKSTGFTLLEVIISLVILTVALTAIITVGSTRAQTLLELQQSNHALLVANNVLEQYYNEANLNTGIIDGKQENGSIDWNWQLNVSQTDNEHIYRMDVKVAKNPDFEYASAQLVGFKWHN